jgi:pimeloyl-ACP methyl ester carboxylesterase
LQVPSSDHVDIVDLDDPLFGRNRKAAFSKALAESEEARKSEWAVEPWDVDPLPPDPNVKRVLFVIHGIRDVGHWTQKIAVRAKREYASLPGHSLHEIEVITSSYGYFSMLQFLWFRERRKKVAWLVEEYVEAKRRFPSAKFSYIGHSNGTYLVAHAMELFPQIEFERLALAGSVLSSRFNWQRIRSQAQYVLNFTATSDWVVGIFPRIADLLPVDWLLGPSLGGAGIAGFKDPGVQTLGYRKGMQSAAIEEENWPYLARFAVDDSPDFAFPIKRPDDFEVEYRRSRAGAFEGWWGIVTCIGAWIAVLAAALVGLPWVAWMKPAYLWIAPLPLLGGAILAAALSELLSAGSELRRRKRLRRRLLWLLLSLVIAGYIALLLSPLTSHLSQLNHGSGEGFRMASTLFYFWCLHRALTRV